MRITGGAARGIPLTVPKGDAVRPATDALRQAVFSSLGGRVSGCVFLDLFAGSGAYGLEALSRGARGGTFVERNGKAAECLRRNLAAVRKSLGQGRASGLAPFGRSRQKSGGDAASTSEPETRCSTSDPQNRDYSSDRPDLDGGGADSVLIEQDVLAGGWGAAPPDLVFVDPPYEIIAESIHAIFERIVGLNPAADAVVVFEMPGELDLPIPGWDIRKRLGKGARQPTAVFYLRQ